MNNKELQAIDNFAKLPLPKLRHYQRLNEMQARIAYQRKMTGALSRLQRMSTIFAMAIMKREWGH